MSHPFVAQFSKRQFFFCFFCFVYDQRVGATFVFTAHCRTKMMIAKRTNDVEFMFVWVYNLFLHFQQKPKMVSNEKTLEIQFWFVCLSFGL